MAMASEYAAKEPSREEVDALAGPTVVEFGSAGCGYCRMAQPAIATAFAGHEGVRHIKIADGSGRRLGRSFTVKLWPTLVFLRDGQEVARLVRPATAAPIAEALARIDPA
ncbi:MAG TPA: thioredoxin family protein [Usitatibacter sp.]|nr:thioredoxin family protein [Usitatibacter sp.]